MAMFENLDDGEFWLPPQFLSDDENNNNNNFESKNKKHNPNNVVVDEAMFRSEFPFGFFGFPSSNLSSPLGGSSETESDEEEQHQIAEFNRLMTRSNLEHDFNNTIKPMGKLVSGSPQSTLCAFGIGCGGCKKCSSQGSPNSVCKLSSARATWDLLHAAAGKVERMRLNQEETYPFQNGPFVSQRKTSSDVAAFYTQQSLSHQQLQIAQFEMLRQQQMVKPQNNGSSSVWGVYQQQRQSKNNNQMVVPNRGGRNNNNTNNNRTLGLSASAWPSLQHAKQIQNQQQQQHQQFGSSNGMRAVFLGGGRRECAGTGVFLPRPAESRIKPACSTALVPDRVVQALNRKMEDMVGGQQQHLHRFNAPSNMEKAFPRLGRNYGFSQQKSSLMPQPAMNHEIRLPQEWTY
ncbi:PREDICTED: protein kinase 4 isoform X2 [Lupinus angustifolius]|uniref:protein kinase 4 isoform X2 n=1 Tax=Lupinus angustifolius TaxID=3871 RepID=UPI00092E46AD|nr:PREDICTED: protein kinase 4 isoform X2 [Lupinus angustifolius]